MTYHLVDLENIPVKWPSLIDVNPGDIILIFKLENPNDKNYISLEDTIKLVNYKIDIRIIECKNGKPKMNSLDFQLISYAGFIIGKDKDCKINIYSNDTGFDPVIEFWTNRCRNIKRIGENNL
jgi:hypothetical protein